MAKPTTFVGSSVAIFLEDTANPGTFLRPCGLNSHTVTFSKNTQDVTVPDCDDPELPAWIERGVESLDFSANGSGILAAEALDNWWAAFNTTDSIKARIYVGKATDTNNGRFWEGKVHVTSFETSGERGNKAQCTVSVVSDGELTYNTVT
ncbi:phage tail tube protein [Thioclava litoralis]|uniref:Phage tail tube protein n=1 Tax=Thioclava litoralis TaxID=3076557 RepID=A0ABZ1DVS7_9RHOB|nr:phage tail tube protein [Thioclava sp. FTW29]